MRIAVITQHFPTSREPWHGQTAYQTLRVLAEQCDVHVFYPEAVHPFSSLLPEKMRNGAIDREWKPAGVDTSYIPYPVIPGLSRDINGYTMAMRLLPKVREFKPDIIYSYTVYPDGFAAVQIARKLGVPSVVVAVGSDLNRIPDPLCKLLTRLALRRADFVSTVSLDLCKTACSLGAPPDRTSANLNGCDTSLFFPKDTQAARRALGIDPDGDVIVYVGRLDVRKGLTELIDSVAQLQITRPSLRCYIVGGGPDRDILTTAILRHDATESIVLVPSCTTDQVALWMAAATLTTLPSYAEGCPNVVIESLASGRPVVATNVGGIPEVLNNTCGRLVPARDVPALTEALEEVLRQKWDAQAISRANSRSWTDVADEVLATFDKALART